jgi:hypothetical protein
MSNHEAIIIIIENVEVEDLSDLTRAIADWTMLPRVPAAV